MIPGGRFREIYYWDSYFTMHGLEASGRVDLIRAMVHNFAHLIDTYGHIPNGNRTYYLSRSQPPFFSLMVDLLAEEKGNGVFVEYLPALQKEYNYWMDETAPTKHLVKMPDGSDLNRYYDQLDTPRPESYRQDVETSEASTKDPKIIYRNLRSAAESGWDFSSRWFADGQNITTINTTELIPVDLNGLLYHLETTLAKAFRVRGDASKNDLAVAKKFEEAAERPQQRRFQRIAGKALRFPEQAANELVELLLVGDFQEIRGKLFHFVFIEGALSLAAVFLRNSRIPEFLVSSCRTPPPPHRPRNP